MTTLRVRPRPPRRRRLVRSIAYNEGVLPPAHERIGSKGETLIREPATHRFGERQSSVEDFAGHHWTFSQSVADVAAEEWGGISEHIS